ncbi:SRPBCC family protein [Roseateles sp.]|uniref:SRPBCC family protein n=1 Tax=Roseateles sp. TaxID=1971397 RepID=UPI0025D6C6CE|nr:SRPBCC family protein [Roseateles sp.]MBV8037197.1 SRPBCC family protein [Roseateles sp.]
MSPLFFALALLLVVLLVYMGRYSGRVRAEATRFIAAPPDAVRARVADLAQWQAWNPWLEHAREARATVEGDTLAWDMPQVGRGQVHALKAPAPQALRQRLRFWLPFACKGRSDWRFDPAPGGTQVTWRFKGRVAFTLRAFAATVQGATQLDLRFGLDRLAEALQADPAPYALAYLGVQDQPARRYAQQPYRGPLDSLAAELPPRIAEVRAELARAALPADGTAVAHYLKTHLKLRTVECRVGVELPAAIDLPAGLKPYEQPPHAAYLVRMDGPPESLEMAWYQAMQRLRVEQRQPHPQLPPYARYLTTSAPGQPGTVELHLPLKVG